MTTNADLDGITNQREVRERAVRQKACFHSTQKSFARVQPLFVRLLFSPRLS